MIRVMLFQCSPRRKDNCPDQWSKTHRLAADIIEKAAKDIEVDYCDISVSPEARIAPCKGCVSTAGGFHCHYPCDCYAANAPDPLKRDYMHDAAIYERMEAADGFFFLTPIHWYSGTTQLKAMMDRLVCINLTITAEQARELGIYKNAEKSTVFEQDLDYHYLLKNHYEGKYAAFFVHGDAGATDYRSFARKTDRRLPVIPEAYAQHLKNNWEGWLNDPRNTVMNFVWQCRYSGIYVPENLIVGINATKGISYSAANEKAITNLEEFYLEGLETFNRLCDYLRT